MYNTILDICFPGVLVVVLYRSFLAPILVSQWIPSKVQALLTCPLCFGFHVSWLWLALRCTARCTDTSLGEHVSLLHWLTIPLLGSLFSYILEHIVTVITNAEQVLSRLENLEAVAATDATTATASSIAEEDIVVEDRRRG